LASLLICGAIALGQIGQNAKSSGSAAKGKQGTAAAQQTFSANCAGCHGLDGKGGERAPDIVTRPNIRQLSDSDLLQILQKGIPQKAMPSFGHLGDPALRSVVAYLRALQGNPAAVRLPGDPRHGETLFFGKAECSHCHMVRGEGGFFASDLSTYSRGHSPEIIRGAIVSPNQNLDPRGRTVTVTLRNGKHLEGMARNEDNFSIQLMTQDGTIHLFAKSDLATLDYRNVSPMPADYGTRLSNAELDDLVNYLAIVSKKGMKPSADNEESDEE